MSKRFVVDFRIAAAERNALPDSEWRWPVPQSDYDAPMREFVDWAYKLPAELAHDEQLGITFELCESDAINDVASIVGTWIDVSTAHQQGLGLVFHKNQHLYEMLNQDQFGGYFPFVEARAVGENALRNRKRMGVRFVRNNVDRARSIVVGRPLVHSINANLLSKELTEGRANPLRLVYADVAVQRSRRKDIHPDLPDLAMAICSKVFTSLENCGHPPSKNLKAYLSDVILKRLSAAWHDREFVPWFKPKSSMTLFEGTGGNYLTRVVGNSFQRRDARVIRMCHGEHFLFDHPRWAPIELPLTDVYVTFGTAAAKAIRLLADRHKSLRKEHRQISVVAAGSRHHGEIVRRSAPNSNVNKVCVIAAAFTGTLRAIPNVKLHDVVYYEWHRRLLSMIRSAGFEVISKRHPKGLGTGDRLFGDLVSTELRQARMSDTYDLADAYVMDIAGGAFLESVCTLKPVVLIDIPNRAMTEVGRRHLEESVQVIRADFDENNRVIVDRGKLEEAIRKPVNIDARRRLISDYLTESDQSLQDLLHSTFAQR